MVVQLPRDLLVRTFLNSANVQPRKMKEKKGWVDPRASLPLLNGSEGDTPNVIGMKNTLVKKA